MPAKTTGWTAAVSTDWNVAGNWTNGVAVGNDTINITTETAPVEYVPSDYTFNIAVTAGIEVDIATWLNLGSNDLGTLLVNHASAAVTLGEIVPQGDITVTAGELVLADNGCTSVAVGVAGVLSAGAATIEGTLVNAGSATFDGTTVTGATENTGTIDGPGVTFTGTLTNNGSVNAPCTVTALAGSGNYGGDITLAGAANFGSAAIFATAALTIDGASATSIANTNAIVTGYGGVVTISNITLTSGPSIKARNWTGTGNAAGAVETLAPHWMTGLR